VRLPSSAETVGRVAEEQVQQGNVELKDGFPESGMAWSLSTFLVAVIASAVLLGIAIYLFIRWRNTGQRTVAVSAATDLVPEKNLEGEAGKAPPETTIGKKGRNSNPDRTPDLFSTGAGPSPNETLTAATGRPSRRPVLPKNLPKAIQFLEDRELDWLLRVAIQEAKRRGRPMPTTVAPPTSTPAASSSVPIAEQVRPSRRSIHKQAIGVAAEPLTRGQVNAVRVAFKAGVTPSRIARQFALSKSDVRRALAADEPER
jgi:hypothetical protein